MINEYDYDKANMYYSRGQISFADLIAVINGKVSLNQLEQERLYVA